jgi:hypothetical protein
MPASDSSVRPAQNRLVLALPQADDKRLQAEPQDVFRPHGQVLFEPRERITHVYFPQHCVVPLLTRVASPLRIAPASNARRACAIGPSWRIMRAPPASVSVPGERSSEFDYEHRGGYPQWCRESPSGFRHDIPAAYSARWATPLSSGAFAMPLQSIGRSSKLSAMHRVLVVCRERFFAARRSGL